MSDLIVGIDLGTTNSVLAAVLDNDVKVIRIHGQELLPSCVGLSPKGELIVGQTARNQLVAAPESTVMSIKRKMGENLRISMGGKDFSPEEISSFILLELKKEGEKALGRSIRKAVITVPAFFNERQRKATQVAGELAGLDVVRIINEPTAAALAYGAGRTADQTLLVYDLGGGTFDVSLVTVEDGVVEVKASHGDTRLGGDDFDQLLVDHAVLEFKKRHNVDLLQDPAALRRLKLAMEAAKCRLSDEPYVTVREEYITPALHLEMELERSDYEEMIRNLMDQTLVCVQQTLQDARLAPKDLHKVMLVGGATRTPLAQGLLRERLSTDPSWEISPDLIVAMGAAVQGAIIAGQKKHSILVDITPHTFSTAVLGSHNGYRRLIASPLIRRNTPLPVSKAEIYSTIVDDQESVNVSAYQGESELPEQNTLIGEFTVNGLSPVPAGNPVAIQFELDLNGMLKVTALEKSSGLSKTVTMDTRGAVSHLNMDEARRNIAALLDRGMPDEAPAAPEAPVSQAEAPSAPEAPVPQTALARQLPEKLLGSAKDLRKRAELLLDKNISPEDAEEIRDMVHNSSAAIKDRDWRALSEHNAALSDLLFYLED